MTGIPRIGPQPVRYGCWRVGLPMICLLLIVSNPLIAQTEERTAESQTDGSEEREPPHRVAIFLGNSHEDGENFATSGFDYEYRLASVPFLGFGGLIDHAFGEVDATLYLAAASFHPVGGLVLATGAGFEHEDGENKFAIRLTVGYEFSFGKFWIEPEFNADFIDGDEIQVAGANLGWAF